MKDLFIEARDLAAEKMRAAGQLLQGDPGRGSPRSRRLGVPAMTGQRPVPPMRGERIGRGYRRGPVRIMALAWSMSGSIDAILLVDLNSPRKQRLYGDADLSPASR